MCQTVLWELEPSNEKREIQPDGAYGDQVSK